MNANKIILDVTDTLKPVLLKIFPYKLLKVIKLRMIHNSINSLEDTTIQVFDPNMYPAGINLIGNIKAESGLGQSCRLLANEIDGSKVPFAIYQYNQLGSAKDTNDLWDNKISDSLPYNINIIHINPHDFGLAFLQMGNRVWDYRYNIAFWLWELEEFPDEWIPCFNCLNEIWTPSEFISNSIRKKTSLPVITIPYYVTVNDRKKYGREYFHLPENQFLFLTMYDHNSVMERKNPKGTLEAFSLAFDKKNDDVGIVIKINNSCDEDLEVIRTILSEYKNVYIITEILNKEQVDCLIGCCNVLISLHRAEGFGLVLAEAMLLGTPTIATNWSSNTEFMNDEVSCLVDYKIIELEKDYLPFKKGNHWADPDIIQAADYMKKLYCDQEYYNRIKDNGKKHIQEKLSLAQASGLINNRVKEIMEQYETKKDCIN
jgi:Glycosyltransferase